LNDFDKVVAVRTSRHDLAVLQNDHKDLMKQIEKELYALHAILKQNENTSSSSASSSSSSTTSSTNTTTTNTQQPINNNKTESIPIQQQPQQQPPQQQPQQHQTSSLKSLEPFAKIDDVAANGPSFHSGLKVGDLLLKFGNVVKENNNNLKSLSTVTLQNEGKSIEIIVRRSDQILELKLTPQKWSGKGLLGCHLVPYNGK